MTDKMTLWKSKAIKGGDENAFAGHIEHGSVLVHDGERFHRELKKFIRQHPSFDRDDLQNWLNLFWFMTKDTRDMKEMLM